MLRDIHKEKTNKKYSSNDRFIWLLTNVNQSAEGAGGLGIIRSNKVGETE